MVFAIRISNLEQNVVGTAQSINDFAVPCISHTQVIVPKLSFEIDAGSSTV